MAPTLENPPRWHKCYRPREIWNAAEPVLICMMRMTHEQGLFTPARRDRQAGMNLYMLITWMYPPEREESHDFDDCAHMECLAP